MKSALLVLSLAFPAYAQPIDIGLRHVVGFYGETAYEAGRLDVPMSRGFAATAEVFWTESLTTHAAATFVNPEAILYTPDDTDLGTVGMDIVSVEARWHFRPRARIAPFAGAGAAVVFFGNLDDRFGDAIEANVDTELTFIADAGVRYRIHPRIALEAGVRYLPLQPSLDVERTNIPLPAKLDLDVAILSFGASWRF